MTNSIYLIGVAVVISGVILGFIFQVKSLWGCLRSEASGQSMHETHSSLEHEHDPDDPYTSLHQPANDLYQTLSSEHHHTQTNSAQKLSQLNYQEMDQSCKISEKTKARLPRTVVCHIV